MILVVGSVVLSAIAMSSMLVLAFRNRAGWLLSILFNLLGIPYDYITHQYGFMATGALGLIVASTAWHKWGSSPPV